MINYIEKGLGLHRAINESGHSIEQINGVWISSNDTAVQAIINSYDSLPYERAEKKAELVKDSEEVLNLQVLSKYPRFEIDSWQNQKADAEAYTLDINATTLTLDALSSVRGITKEVAAERILNKAAQFAVLSASYAGERQRLEDLVDNALTIEEIHAIKFQPIEI